MKIDQEWIDRSDRGLAHLQDLEKASGLSSGRTGESIQRLAIMQLLLDIRSLLEELVNDE